jgi:hypothetical protein
VCGTAAAWEALKLRLAHEEDDPMVEERPAQKRRFIAVWATIFGTVVVCIFLFIGGLPAGWLLAVLVILLVLAAFLFRLFGATE